LRSLVREKGGSWKTWLVQALKDKSVTRALMRGLSIAGIDVAQKSQNAKNRGEDSLRCLTEKRK